ncbi:Pentatricopeptide repeat-containing protein, mitochondrial [Vitis vinifera]|uniref:Pentatricopeptide repeat-containing protein, mitochondrial n=1 Tax=Vitis vinifera TaxID=29760 RepID=A0A438IEW8_VITVI|nr:Pentatricopeptide repeat-containing protein, mitochondrial [Vitis vinifera]
MLQTGKESMPDDESYELVVGFFAECVRSCVNKGRLDALVSIIERCKMDCSGENARGHVLLSMDEGLLYQHLELLRAFSTLHEFETAYRNSPKEAEEDIFSPFTSLHPLVMASSKKGFETLDTGWDEFMRFISFSLGDWRRVRFCHDIWCGELLLHVRFPELFSIVVDREGVRFGKGYFGSY